MKIFLTVLLFCGLAWADDIPLPQDAAYQAQMKNAHALVKQSFPDAYFPGTVLNAQFVSAISQAYKKKPDTFKNPNWPIKIILDCPEAIVEAASPTPTVREAVKLPEISEEEMSIKRELAQESRNAAAELKRLQQRETALDAEEVAVSASLVRPSEVIQPVREVYLYPQFAPDQSEQPIAITENPGLIPLRMQVDHMQFEHRMEEQDRSMNEDMRNFWGH